jgi:hypothetical protein
MGIAGFGGFSAAALVLVTGGRFARALRLKANPTTRATASSTPTPAPTPDTCCDHRENERSLARRSQRPAARARVRSRGALAREQCRGSWRRDRRGHSDRHIRGARTQILGMVNARGCLSLPGHDHTTIAQLSCRDRVNYTKCTQALHPHGRQYVLVDPLLPALGLSKCAGGSRPAHLSEGPASLAGPPALPPPVAEHGPPSTAPFVDPPTRARSSSTATPRKPVHTSQNSCTGHAART